MGCKVLEISIQQTHTKLQIFVQYFRKICNYVCVCVCAVLTILLPWPTTQLCAKLVITFGYNVRVHAHVCVCECVYVSLYACVRACVCVCAYVCTAWCNEFGSLTVTSLMHVTQVPPVTAENQFHCTGFMHMFVHVCVYVCTRARVVCVCV